MASSVRKNVSITKQQAQWLRENHINLSRLLQDAIAEEIKRRK
jgi:post-segregation antitoxin (ccd killing protein)